MLQQLDLKAALHIAENMRDVDLECLRQMMGDISNESFAINRWQSNGAAWAFYQDGVPVVMGGIVECMPWLGVAWLISTDNVRLDSWKKLIRFSRNVMKNARQKYRRIEAQCLSTWPAAIDYAATVGFQHISTKDNATRDGHGILEFLIMGEK